MSEWFEESHQIAVTVARKVHRKYHVYFDMQDVAQELTIWILRRQDKIEEWLDHPRNSEEYKMGVKKLGKTLTRHGDKYCRRLKAQKLGYELRDEQFYSEVTLSELLPFVWSDVVNTVDNSKPKVSGGGNPAEGGNYVIQLFDIRRGLSRLSEMDRDVLELRFADQLSDGGPCEYSPGATRERMSRSELRPAEDAAAFPDRLRGELQRSRRPCF